MRLSMLVILRIFFVFGCDFIFDYVFTQIQYRFNAIDNGQLKIIDQYILFDLNFNFCTLSIITLFGQSPNLMQLIFLYQINSINNKCHL